MKLATVKCPNKNCNVTYDAVMEDGDWHATCPECKQENRVPGISMTKDITGICAGCGRPLDDHLYGRLSFACPPKKGK